MIHWQNGPNDRGQALLIAGMFNSQMYMGGVIITVSVIEAITLLGEFDTAVSLAGEFETTVSLAGEIK